MTAAESLARAINEDAGADRVEYRATVFAPWRVVSSAEVIGRRIILYLANGATAEYEPDGMLERGAIIFNRGAAAMRRAA